MEQTPFLLSLLSFIPDSPVAQDYVITEAVENLLSVSASLPGAAADAFSTIQPGVFQCNTSSSFLSLSQIDPSQSLHIGNETHDRILDDVKEVNDDDDDDNEQQDEEDDEQVEEDEQGEELEEGAVKKAKGRKKLPQAVRDANKSRSEMVSK